jgi:UDP-glucose 4-epimerase
MILITGGMGFIGLHTAKQFLDNGEQVVLTQYRSRREPEFLKDYMGKNLQIAHCDVRDRDAVLDVVKQYGVTDIAHLVAPPLFTLPPDEDFDTAVLGVLNMLQLSREAGIKRLTLASSVGVYAGIPAGPFREDMLLTMDVKSPTETFKKVWEILGAHYADRTGFEVVNMRIGQIWGPLFWHGGIFPVVRLCYAAIRGDGLGKGPELFEEDESAPCYVKDCAAGIYAAQTSPGLKHRTYNVSTDMAVTNRRIIQAIQKVIPEFDVQLSPGAGPRNRPNPSLDISRLREDTGFTPKYDIDASVAEYIGWLREHPEETMTGEGEKPPAETH